MSKYTGFNECVLIVDDEEEVVEHGARVAASLGFKILKAHAGDAALELLRGADLPFLILSDFRMPGLDGIQLCREVRKLPKSIPFVLISGRTDREIAVAGIQVGVTDILDKPFLDKDIAAILQKFADARIAVLEEEAREVEEITTLFVDEATTLFEDLEKYILRLEGESVDPAVVDILFRNVHSVKGAAGAVPRGNWLSRLGHSFESCLSLVRTGNLQLDGAGIELFLLTSDLCQKLIQLIKIRQEPSPEFIQSVEICIQSLDAVRSGQAVPLQAVAPVVRAAKSENKSDAKSSDPKENPAENEGIWVSNEKLDSFMRLSGELIVLKNYFQVLNQEPELRNLSSRVTGKITDFSYSLNKITDSLQDQIMSVRKVSLGRALSKLPRIFRQVTKEVDKKIKLNTEGFELGVDRTIANALSTCMTHLLRNAIDHGIEKTADRKETSKPAEGTITISAREQKGVIYISIADDGAGIDRDRVISRAIDKGLLEEEKRHTLTDAEAFDLLYLPGFSTAEKITGISGRGVGMDVVKSEIVNLNGKIRIDSKKGFGSSFNIEVPVPKTVMVEQTVLVKSKDKFIAVPLNAIAQLTSSSKMATTYVGDQLTCQFQGRTVLLKTYDQLSNQIIASDIKKTSPSYHEGCPLVILQYKNDFLGLLVDSIQDQLEAVIRPFDKVTNSFPGFKGTTVLGDDSIAFVIAPDEFVMHGLAITPPAAA